MKNREGEIMLSKKRLICIVLSLVMLAGLINLFASTPPRSGTTMITPNMLTIQWEDGSGEPITINTFRFFDYNVAQLRTMVGALGGAVDNLADDTFQVNPSGRTVSFDEIDFHYEREIDYIINETPIRNHDGTLTRPQQPGWIFIPEFEYNWASIRDIISAMNFTLVDFVDNPADGITEIIVSDEPPAVTSGSDSPTVAPSNSGSGPAVLPPSSHRGIEWSTAVPPDVSFPTLIPTPSPIPDQGIPDATEIILSVSNNVIMITSGPALTISGSAITTGPALSTGPSTVFFYAEVDGHVETVVLLDENGNVVGEMKDDGQFAASGDDLENDGIFTFRMNIDTTKEDILRFNAKFTLNDVSVTSNEVVVYVVAEFTAQELQDIDIVDATIYAMLNSINFRQAAPIPTRHDMMYDTLQDLADQGWIIRESILFDPGSSMFTFTYKSNILGGVLIQNLGDAFDGSVTASSVVTDHPGMPFNSLSTPTNQHAEIGNAVILNSFEDTPFRMDRYYVDPSAPYLVSYSKMADDWSDSGLYTAHDTSVTLPDLRNLQNNEVIWFAGHGSYITYKSTGFLGDTFNTTSNPAWFLNETRSMATDHAYSAELKLQWAVKIFTNHGQSYAILPSFIQESYSIGDFSNSFIVFNSCEIMGRDGNISNAMADAFLYNSAKAFVGYHNPVQSVYSRTFLHAFINELIDAETAQTAFDNASILRGVNSGSVAPVAHPILSGDPEARLININVMNGSFELASTPVFWHAVGDVRIMRNWGELSPFDGARMAFLSTGIGAASTTTQDFFDGTQGSLLEQRIRVSDDATTLSFSYNFVSEEPSFLPNFPTFVGSTFNDAFIIELIDMYDNKTELAYESVNTSNWITTPLTGFRLTMGNSHSGRPAYHIGWQTVEVDITQFQGQTVILRFTVFDRGDQAYDSVGLVDNVVIK